MIEPQCLVERRFDQRPQIEQAGNRIDCRNRIFRQGSIECRPVGREQAGRKMASRGMSAEHERATKPHQFAGRGAHLAKDVVDGDGRAKVVSWNGDADPVRVQAACAMAEK